MIVLSLPLCLSLSPHIMPSTPLSLMANSRRLPPPTLFDQQDTVPEVEDDLQVGAVDAPEIKLFGKWPLDDIQISDMSLQARHVASLPPTLPPLVVPTMATRASAQHTRISIRPLVFPCWYRSALYAWYVRIS